MSGPGVKSLVCVYDLTVNPLTFDFTYFLAISICESRRRGLDGKIFIVVLADGFRNVAVEGEYEESYRYRRISNILMPLISMCAFCTGFFVAKNPVDAKNFFSIDNADYIYHPVGANKFIQRLTSSVTPQWVTTPMVPKQLEEYASHGWYPKESIFAPSPDYVKYFKAKFKPGTVLFHPRRSPYNSDRNTPLGLFEDVADLLVRNGYSCEFVSDIDDSLGASEDARSGQLDATSFSIEARLAAALSATLNVVWTTGAVAPLYFSTASFHMFGFLRERGSISNRNFFARKGPMPDRNPIWLNSPFQLVNWIDADALNPQLIYGSVRSQIVAMA
jgi:hypothetical protein